MIHEAFQCHSFEDTHHKSTVLFSSFKITRFRRTFAVVKAQ